MFGKNRDPVEGKVNTIIGTGSKFDGNLSVEGTLRVDGTVEGEIDINGDMIVGKSGLVRANVRGRNVSVAGEVHGDIILEGKLELTSTGKVYGDIDVAMLVINEGAIFQGKSKMRDGESREKAETAGKEKGKKREVEKAPA